MYEKHSDPNGDLWSTTIFLSIKRELRAHALGPHMCVCICPCVCVCWQQREAHTHKHTNWFGRHWSAIYAHELARILSRSSIGQSLAKTPAPVVRDLTVRAVAARGRFASECRIVRAANVTLLLIRLSNWNANKNTHANAHGSICVDS